MLHNLQSWSISEKPNRLNPPKKSEDSTDMNQVFWGAMKQNRLNWSTPSSAVHLSLLHSQTALYFRDLWWLRLGHISLFPLQKKVIHNPPNNSALFVQRDKAKGSVHNLNLRSSEVNGFVGQSNTVCCECLLPLQGGCLHGDSSEIQRGDNAPGFSPQERPPWVGSGSPTDAPRSSPSRTRIKLSEELTDFVPNSPFYDMALLSDALSGL